MRDYSKLSFSDFQINDAIDRTIVGRNAERNRIILKLSLLHGYSYEQTRSEIRKLMEKM